MRLDLNNWPDQRPIGAPPTPPPWYDGRRDCYAEIGPRIGDIARRLLGPPNADLSSETQLRFGSNGSCAVEIAGKNIGAWFSHETKDGGGISRLLQVVGGINPGADQDEWLRRELGIEPKKKKPFKIVATYDYRDETGGLLFQVCRCDPKDFRQRRPDGNGGWIWSLKGTPRVLYRLPELLAADPELPVWLCEGEKDADRLASAGCIATTSPGGANKWQDSFNEMLRGRHVVLLPDNDEAGRRHMLAVAASLAPVAASVRILDLVLDLPDLPSKGDVSDWLDAGGTVRELMRLGEATPAFVPTPEQQQRLALAEDRRPGEILRQGIPSIATGGGQLSSNIDEAERFLIGAGEPIYQYGDRLVRVARGPIIAAIDHERVEIMGSRTIEMTNIAMRDELTRHVNFTVYDVRSKKDRPINCPADIAEGLLHRVGRWEFPVLTGIVAAPVIRPNLTLIDRVGYDDATGLFLAPGEAVCPQIRAAPTREDAIEAAKYLMHPLREVQFVNDESKSVVLSGVFSGLDRPMLDFVPIHAIDAPQAGSGKGLLCNYIAIIATGHEAPAVGASADPAETDKAIAAKLIQGHSIILLDNVMHPLDSALLAQMMTQGVLDIRILGQSRTVTVPNCALVMANGNNIALLGDLPRRSLKARLDARHERPELRAFTSDYPLTVARRDRANLVAAALTILLAFRRAGSPAPDGITPLGSFERWSTQIRNAIIWLGLPDPVKTQDAIRSVNRRQSAHIALMHAWARIWEPGTKTTAAEMIDAANRLSTDGGMLADRKFAYTDLREALMAAAGGRSGRDIDAVRLGQFLARHVDVAVGDMRIEKDDAMGHGTVAMWRVVKLG